MSITNEKPFLAINYVYFIKWISLTTKTDLPQPRLVGLAPLANDTHSKNIHLIHSPHETHHTLDTRMSVCVHDHHDITGCAFTELFLSCMMTFFHYLTTDDCLSHTVSASRKIKFWIKTYQLAGRVWPGGHHGNDLIRTLKLRHLTHFVCLFSEL